MALSIQHQLKTQAEVDALPERASVKVVCNKDTFYGCIVHLNGIPGIMIPLYAGGAESAESFLPLVNIGDSDAHVRVWVSGITPDIGGGFVISECKEKLIK